MELLTQCEAPPTWLQLGDPLASVISFIWQIAPAMGRVPATQTIYNRFLEAGYNTYFSETQWWKVCHEARQITFKKWDESKFAYGAELKRDFPEFNTKRLSSLLRVWSELVQAGNGWVCSSVLYQRCGGNSSEHKKMKKALLNAGYFQVLQSKWFQPNRKPGICTRYWLGKSHPNYLPLPAPSENPWERIAES